MEGGGGFRGVWRGGQGGGDTCVWRGGQGRGCLKPESPAVPQASQGSPSICVPTMPKFISSSPIAAPPDINSLFRPSPPPPAPPPAPSSPSPSSPGPALLAEDWGSLTSGLDMGQVLPGTPFNPILTFGQAFPVLVTNGTNEVLTAAARFQLGRVVLVRGSAGVVVAA